MMGVMEEARAEMIKIRVKKKEKWSGNYWSVWLERGGIEYQAGQYVSVKVSNEGERRSYSLASFPAEEELQLVVDTTPMGVGSRYVLGLREEEEIEVLGAIGGFVVKEEHRGVESKGFLLVGTGSGVVPLRSMVNDLLKVKGEKRPVRLHWGMRYKEDLFWVDEWRSLEGAFGNFKADVVLSRGGDDWMGCRGHVGDCLREHGQDYQGWRAYVCGSKEMVEETRGLLVDLRVANDQVYFEKFF